MASEDLEDEEEEDDDRLRYNYDMELPPKKRGRPKKLLTDEEIEEATKAAIITKPVIEIIPVPRVPKENGAAPKSTPSTEEVANRAQDTLEGAVAETGWTEAGTAEEGKGGEEETGEGGELPDSKKTARKSAKNSVQENEGFKVILIIEVLQRFRNILK